jgi:hypothetical protein
MQSLGWVRTLIETEQVKGVYNCHSFVEAMIRRAEGDVSNEQHFKRATEDLYLRLRLKSEYVLNLEDVLPLLDKNIVTYHILAKGRNSQSAGLTDPEVLLHSGLIAPLDMQINIDDWPNSCMLLEREAITTYSRISLDIGSAIEYRTFSNAMEYYNTYYANVIEVRFYYWPITQ